MKVNKLTHKLLSENLALDDFSAMLEEANHNVVRNLTFTSSSQLALLGLWLYNYKLGIPIAINVTLHYL